MSATAQDRPAETAEEFKARQMREAEELLFSGPPKEGFAKALFRGQFRDQSVLPYPRLPDAQRDEAMRAAEEVRAFARDHIDAAKIDREADIPREVILGLGRLGVLGMTAPKAFGGRAFGQSAYCRVMEVIGGHCASTAVFVNAHHSIGIRALLLFGTEEQKARWIPGLMSGEKIAAFALTEREAGSDAGNVRTRATPSDDGQSYILNGQKRYITNGGIADVLTVMARTPDPSDPDGKITAFLVTPDMPGFIVTEERKPKCGIRGTATGELRFEDMRVPKENVLGSLGKGLKVALTVLDFGRTTFGASCTGAAKTCLAAAVEHANRRKQFGRTLGEIDLIRKKIARIAAHTYAMEATTYETAALIDSGAEDYMLETAILKVYTTDALWEIVYETLQVHGGQGYFDDQPYERMMRDARINTIGEGANEVLKAFIALVGMRDTGKKFEATLKGVKSVTGFFPTIFRFLSGETKQLMGRVEVPVKSRELSWAADKLGRRIYRFGWAIQSALASYREGILERQLPQERIADAAIALYTASCTLARMDAEIGDRSITPLDRSAGELYLRTAFRNFDRALAGQRDHDDDLTLATAELALRG